MKTLALVALVSITACGSSSPEPTPVPEKPRVTVRHPPPAKPAAPTAKPFVVPPSEPGPAYIALHDGIAVMLVDGTVQRVSGVTGWAKEITLGLDGQIHAVMDGAGESLDIYKLDGATGSKLGSIRAYTATAAAFGNDGVGYVAQNDDVFRFDGKRGTKIAKPGTPEQVSQLAFDAGGNLIAAGMGGASVLQGDTWAPLELPGVEKYQTVTLAGQGKQLVITTRDAMFELSAGKLNKLLGGIKTMRAPAMSSTGILAIPAYGSKHAITKLYDRNSGATTTSDRLGTGALDGRGRQWYVAGGGLIVESLLDKERTEYPIGTLAPLVKVGDSTERILVIGGGPSTLPPVGAPVVVESVTGKIVLGSSPLANAQIEICTYAAISYRTSPCGGNRSLQAAITDDKGQFTFRNVPLGEYSLTFKTGAKWGIASGTSIALVRPSPAQSIGTLRY